MIKAIVTDIEGTTSALSFVKEVLFPYARTHLAAFVGQHKEDPEVRRCLDETRRLAGANLDDAQTIEQLLRWIDEDKKIAPLKVLQGLIWEVGYRTGAFQGHVYEDAVNNLRRWKARGLRLFVYSSGSVYAQKLLFAHTAHGDLTALFENYFDITIGAKKETESYHKIAQSIGLNPAELLFLSDIQDELDAARNAGLQTVWLVRDSLLDPDAAHRQARDFDGVEV